MVVPLDVFSAEAAALDNSSSLLLLLGWIVSKAREVRRFRKDIKELTNTCIALSLTFLENEKALHDSTLSADFKVCLQEVYFLVMECAEWNIAHVTFDVVFKHKIKLLCDRFDEMRKAFGLEILMKLQGSSSKIAKDFQDLMAKMDDMKDAQDDDAKDRENMLKQLNSLHSDIQDWKKESMSLMPTARPYLDIIHLPDTCITIAASGPDSKPLVGTYNGARVTFEAVLDKSRVTDELPRVVKLYREMTGVAQIQKLYGIAEKDGEFYSVMEDMEQHAMLAKAVGVDGIIAKMDEIQKLRVAYEIAATVAALHRSGILVKVLSDVTVHLETSPDGRVRPKIAGLRHARRIWETTTRDKQDARFDAPETEPAGSRSKMSDVWALGAILCMVFTGELPFGVASSVQNQEEQDRIRSLLKKGERPFVLEPDQTPKGLAVVEECFQIDPFLRPPSSWVAEQLFNLMIRTGAQKITTTFLPAVETRQESSGEEKAIVVKLTTQICRLAKQSKTQSASKLTEDDVQPLVKAASEETNPVYAFALGLAYVRGLVEVSEDEDLVAGSSTTKVLCARRAIPYLQVAEQQGHVDAIKELVRAHKLLAEHYYSRLKIDTVDD